MAVVRQMAAERLRLFAGKLRNAARILDRLAVETSLSPEQDGEVTMSATQILAEVEARADRILGAADATTELLEALLPPDPPPAQPIKEEF